MMTRTKRLLAPSAIGQTNRARVLELLHREGPSSRAQLARQLHVSRATVATILQPFLDDGLLIEGEPMPSSTMGGKPARPIWFHADGVHLGAMRISPTDVQAARLGFDGAIVTRSRRTVRSRGQEQGPSAAEFRRAILAVSRHCFADANLLGIGVAASGMVNTATGTILSLHLAPALNGFCVSAELNREFDLPVYVDHHPRVQALGDKWFGHGRRLVDFASVYTGEALGFGIVHHGEILRGEVGAGGESGHTVVDLNGTECLCGRRGCWETVATLTWLRSQAAKRGLADSADLSCAALAVRAAAGEAPAVRLLDEYARNLAIGMANNDQVLASTNYIVHGDAVGGGEAMRARLQFWMEEFCPRRGLAPTVIFADSPDDMTLLGGGGLVLSSRLDTTV